MLIESKIKIGHDSMFNINQANFKSTHLLNKMALVQFQRNSTVVSRLSHLTAILSKNELFVKNQSKWAFSELMCTSPI